MCFLDFLLFSFFQFKPENSEILVLFQKKTKKKKKKKKKKTKPKKKNNKQKSQKNRQCIKVIIFLFPVYETNR